MIIKTSLSPKVRGTLAYNLDKMKSMNEDGVPNSEIIYSNVGFGDLKSISNSMDRVSYAYPTNHLINRYCHIKVSISPEEELTNYSFVRIGKSVIQGLGFELDDTPFIIFRHHDTEHDHIHIALGRVDVNQNLTKMSFSVYKSMKIARTLENVYGLKNPNKQNLDKNGIRRSNAFETKNEFKNLRYSNNRFIRSAVSDALSSTLNLGDYINKLEQSNIAIRFRVNKKTSGEKVIGLSYRLLIEKPNVSPKYLSIPLDLKLENREEFMEDLLNDNQASNKGVNYYVDNSNLLKINDSRQPFKGLKDMAIRGSKLGPGAEWYSLKKKYDLDIKMFDGLVKKELPVQHLPSSTVWEFEGDDLFPPKDPLVHIAQLGVEKNLMGSIKEAVEEGFDFDQLLYGNPSLISNPDIKDKIKLYSENDEMSVPDFFHQLPEIKDAVEYNAAIIGSYDQDIALDIALGIVDDKLIAPLNRIEMAKSEDYELDMFDNPDKIREQELEEVKNIEARLAEDFVNNNKAEIEKALNSSVNFLIIKDLLIFHKGNNENLDSELLSKIEQRIAHQMHPTPNEDKIINDSLNETVGLRDNDLRYLVHLNFVDFRRIEEKEEIWNPDNRVLDLILTRLQNDHKYLPSAVKADQLIIDDAIWQKKEKVLIELLPMPLLDFSKAKVEDYIDLLTPKELDLLKNRVALDQGRTLDLESYQKGNLRFDFTEMVIDKTNLYSIKPISNEDLNLNINSKQKSKSKGKEIGG